MLNVAERDVMLNHIVVVFLYSTVPLCFLSIKAQISLGLFPCDASAGGREESEDGGGVTISCQNDVELNYYIIIIIIIYTCVFNT